MKKYFLWVFPLAWATLIWRLTTTPDLSLTQDSFLSFLISNGGHFIFFGILAVLLKLSMTIHDNHMTIYAITITSLYGLVIEFVQRGVPGRTGDPFDWFLDTLGAVTFVYLFHKFSQRKV